MTSQPVEANVVLTADNSGYDQAMGQSATATDRVSASVDALGNKITKMTKVAGKSLIGISVADTGMIVGATKAWNDYEKQMARLNSQSAVLSRTQDQQTKVMKDYTGAVKNLRSEFGTSTSEAAKLVETLSKVTSVKQSRDLQDLSQVFIKMAAATGESSEGLASSLTNLQKIMGTPINAQQSKKYADTFTYLAAQTNSSAQGLMDFTAQLAPVAKSLGMNTQQVAGFATAFTKAGADGGAAATAFTKVTGDLLKSLQSGSPELAHYANIVGTTQGNFRKLAKDNSAEAVVEIFESLARHSKSATTELNRLGLDGPRTIRQITQMMNAPGGIRASMGMAEDPRAKGATDRGYQATMAGLSDEFDKLQEDLKQTAEAFATYLGPALELFLKGMEKAASIVQSITEGPMGKFLQVVSGFLAPLAGAAGLLLLFAGALVKVASAFTLLRSSAAYGLREGFGGAAGLTKTGVDAEGRSMFGPMGGGALGKRGAQLAEGGTWIQRGLYTGGAFAGQGLGAFRRGGAVPESWYQTREALSSKIPWTEQYARPTEGTMRGPLSYLAGGVAKGIDEFVTPTFDAMRYADPTKRRQWVDREAPWAKLSQRADLVRSMGRTGLVEGQMDTVRSEIAKVHEDPLMTNEAREARLQELRTIRSETQQRVTSARAQESADREVIASQQLLTRENETAAASTKGLGASLGKLGANVGGGILGAGRAGLGAAWRSGMVGQGVAMGATIAGGMTGSNALMMGGTGAMIGSMLPGPGTVIGAGVGTAAGLAMDAAHANDSVTESIKNLNDQADEASRTGSGLSDLNQATLDSQKGLDDWSKSIGGSGSKLDYWFGAPKLSQITKAPGAVKNLVEGVLGSSDVEEAQKKQDEAVSKAKNTEAAIRDLAKASGVKLTGSDTNQRAQLEQFMSNRGQAALGAANIELPDFIAARKEGGAHYQQMIQQATAPGQANGMWDRLRTTAAGSAMLDDKTARQSIRYQGDVAKFYDATNEVFDKMRNSGMSYLDIIKSTEQAQQKIGDENTREYELQMAMSQKAQQALQMQAPQLGRAATFTQQLQLGATVMGIKPKTEEQATQIEQQKQATEQAIADNDAYFRQMLLAQQQYDRSRRRAQDDFALQRQYQEYDYNLQRSRAEESFNRMRARAVADYHRSVSRAWSDFNLQRSRQEDDYNHQLEVQAKQRVLSMNLYQRTDTQNTSSATWLSANAGDMISRMRTQIADLRKLRSFGVTDEAIQMYQLASPENQQELSRLVAEMTPRMAQRFNRNVSTMTRLSGRLGQDPGNLDAAEQERGYRQSRERGMADMRRTMQRGHDDFERGLRQQRQDFNIMMDQQAEDYETQQDRQLKAYHTSMHRAAVDMAHMADEITGSIESVLVRAHKKLTGSAQEQAGIALKAFQDLKASTTPEAVSLMQDLSRVFGFKYTNPLTGGGGDAASTMPSIGGRTTAGEASGSIAAPYHHGGPAPAYVPGAAPGSSPSAGGAAGFHAGGTVPGWSPGRDTVMVNLSGGEAIMRPEWARAIGEQNINAMNHAAKHGLITKTGGVAAGSGYADGGIYRPVKGGTLVQGPHDQFTGYTALDIGVPVGTPVYAVESGLISRSYDITGYEPRRKLPQDGYKSYGRVMYLQTDHGPTLVYAHLSKRGFSQGTHVQGGQAIGLSGNSGYVLGVTGAHLHFGDSDGNPGEFMGGDVGSGTIQGGVTGGEVSVGATMTRGQARRMVARDVLKAVYAKAEAAAAKMHGVHPLQAGMISQVINRMAIRKINQLVRTYGAPGAVGGGGLTSLDPAAGYGGGAAGVWRALTSAGFTKVQAAGIMGNMQSESGFDPFIVQGGGHSMNPAAAGGGGYGLVQWTPGSKLNSYLKGNPPSVASEVNALSAQLAGHGSSPEGAAGAALRQARSVAEAARAFEMKYERHAGPPQPNRTSQAQAIYDRYAADGAIIHKGPQRLVVGEEGPEAVIPLNDKGGEFLARSLGLTTAPMAGGSVSISNYRIDRSTNFTGPITVQANDPNELLAKLQARQRVRALSRPSLTGSAA
jgi:TP901 family phage tail tape measure protein